MKPLSQQPRASRLEMDLAARGLPGAVCLGRYHYRAAQPGLPEHSHAGMLEICYLVKGRQTYEVGGRAWRLRGGDVFVTQPGERHGTGLHPE
ncbi:MAG: cupin domain-containing protein [Puniceicoccaceae bacterium]|nr:MAG: cupin domain-containing protein [Puniceicoccaceae bacterium]